MSRQVKGTLVLLAVFLLGAGSGGGAVYAWREQRHAAAMRDRGGDFEAHRLHALTRRLELDADQQEKVRTILTKDHDEARTLGRDVFDRCGQPLLEHKAKIDAEIRQVLRPDQQKRYDALVDERREHVWLGPR